MVVCGRVCLEEVVGRRGSVGQAYRIVRRSFRVGMPRMEKGIVRVLLVCPTTPERHARCRGGGGGGGLSATGRH